MPHIEIQHFPKELDAQAREGLAQEMTQLICTYFAVKPESVSIALEPVLPAQWKEQVYQPQIEGRGEQLLQAPGYSM